MQRSLGKHRPQTHLKPVNVSDGNDFGAFHGNQNVLIEANLAFTFCRRFRLTPAFGRAPMAALCLVVRLILLSPYRPTSLYFSVQFF